MSAPITNSPCHSAYEWRKRARSMDDDNNKLAKRGRYYYILASESSSMSDDGTESVYSIQGKETDYCRDTSDTDTKSEMSDFDIQVEYEVASSSEEENVFDDGSSSGNDDVLLAAGAVAVSMVDDRSIDLWMTDGDDDDDDTDSGASMADSHLQDCQKCRMCKTRETFNRFPLCTHCHQMRKNFFPPRPRRLRKRKEEKRNIPQVTTDKLRSCLNGLSQDSGICSSQELQPLAWDKVIVPDNLINKATGSNASLSLDPTPMTSSSQESMMSELTASVSSSFDDSLANWTVATTEMCIMCNERPKNGIFLHNTGGHMCCCYKCAVKFWNKSKRCAYCNRKVKNVVKAFVV